MGGYHSGSLTVNVRPKRELLEQVLEAVPGIDRGRACAILAELGPDQSAFASPRQVAAQACVAPGNNQVADKRRAGRVRPGDSTLRATLAERPHPAVRTGNTQSRNCHEAHEGRPSYKRTILAMLQEHRPTGIPAYQALVMERNASRLLRNLRRHGCLGGLQDAAGSSAESSQPSRPEMGGRWGHRSGATLTGYGIRAAFRQSTGHSAMREHRGIREAASSTRGRF